MLKKIFAPGSHPASINLALLVLRVWIGATMLLNHGIGKVTGFSSMSHGFPDPLGVGHVTSMALVVFAEAVASSLLVLGLVTRFAALVLAVDVGVAFFAVHKAALSGGHSGELAFIYLAGFVTLLLAGGGAISADAAAFKGGSAKGG